LVDQSPHGEIRQKNQRENGGEATEGEHGRYHYPSATL
jgi:hypothetical protein